jgi:hypothetical protein
MKDVKKIKKNDRWRMKKVIEKFGNLVKGCITGFDRVVFKGFFLPLMNPKGAMDFCRSNSILNKVMFFAAQR